MEFSKYRDLFPVTRNWVYLYTGAVAPISTPVREACVRYLDELSRDGFRHYSTGEVTRQLHDSRRLFAQIVNCDVNEVALVPSTSYGIGMVALMLQLKKGENVVLNDLDFTANIYPWLRLTKVGVNVRMARSKNGILPVNEIEKHVDDKTRVITATHVTTDSGFRHDLKALAKLAHAHGAYVVADGASSTGVIPVDLNDIDVDFFAASSQKWLLGPAGSGFLYVNSRLIDELEPVLPGWYGTKSLGNIDALAWENIEFSHGSAAKFEVGTPSLLSNVGVSAGMRMLLDVGLTNVHRRVSDLTQYALEKLRAIGLNVITPADREKRAGDIVVRMKPGNVALTVQRALESKRIMTEALDESEHQLRLGWKGGCLRFSPCFFNTEKEVDTLTEALHSIM